MDSSQQRDFPRVALVTGASRNMGLAIAIELGRRGYKVALNGRASQERLNSAVAAVRETGAQAVGVLGDVSDVNFVKEMLIETDERLGSIDVLIHTPAVRPIQPYLEITQRDWRGVMTANLESLLHTTQAVLPQMIKQGWGRILGFSGSAAFLGATERAHVMASKTAIVGLIRALATEYASQGITANTIVPGPFETERPDVWKVSDYQMPAARKDKPATITPMGRHGQPDEVAALCAFMVSEDAGFITGQSLHINGGSYIA